MILFIGGPVDWEGGPVDPPTFGSIVSNKPAFLLAASLITKK